MGTGETTGRLDLSGDSFVIQSSLLGPDYVIKTADGTELLWTRRQFFDESTEYLYLDDADEVCFRYERRAPGSFRLVDVRTETTLGTLEREDEDVSYRWEIRPAESDGVTARIVGEKRRVSLLRSQRGQSMSILGPDGADAGRVSRRLLAVHFTFDVEITGLDRTTKTLVLLAVTLLYDVMQESSSMFRE